MFILPIRMQEKIMPEPMSGCWLWIGAWNKDGYGQTTLMGKSNNAHLIIYRILVGAIPKGLKLDHLCRNRACVNPVHLEPVSNQENIRRGKEASKRFCKNGHEFTPENTRIISNPNRAASPLLSGRQCLTCLQVNARRYYERKKQCRGI